MVSTLPVVQSIADLRAIVAGWRAQQETIGLIPTMGALHEGHLSLVDRCRARCDRSIVTIFVNPIQFGPAEDFSAYPRRESDDIVMLQERQCDLAFVPPVAELFPGGYGAADFRTSVTVSGLGDVLCGRDRPGHFSGVATQVMKLLLITLPDVALFGEKDYQQLQVIRTMVRDLHVPVAIDAAPTVREADGLAMSSRNVYLSPQQRARAPLLYATLRLAADRIVGGEPPDAVCADALTALRNGGFDPIDYVTLVDADTLQTLTTLDRPGRLAAAARLGPARLIDNIPVLPW